MSLIILRTGFRTVSVTMMLDLCVLARSWRAGSRLLPFPASLKFNIVMRTVRNPSIHKIVKRSKLLYAAFDQ